MVKLILSNEKMITLTRNNKTITRSELDYQTNKAMYDFRGFKQAQDVVKEVKEVDQTFENETKVIPLNIKKKKNERKKMNQLIKLKLKKWCKWVWVKAKNNPMYSIPLVVLIIYIIWK
jgi:DUF4097 and DUF4098 domain-containing protein YvlB